MEQPVVDAEEEAMRELGRETDIAEGRPTESEGATPPEPSAPPAEEAERPQPTPAKPVSSEPETAAPSTEEGRERDDKGRFKAQEPPQKTNGQAAPPEPPTAPLLQEEKPRSRYAEARERESKEDVRKERSWTALQQEKEQFRAQQEKWEQERRMEQLQVQSKPKPLEKGGIDIQGYQRAYQDFRQQGDWENAARSLETVLELEAVGRQESERQQHAQAELQWRTDMDAAMARQTDLRDPNSALYQEVDRLVKQEPYLFYIPNGFHKAVEIATLLLSAGSDSELREENEKLRARLEQLEHSSQPARGGPGKPPQGPRRQEEMSLDEEESHLRELSSREDSFMRR